MSTSPQYPVPANPKIYHITHVDNLPSILATGRLWSDAEMIRQGHAVSTIGMGQIKQRRLVSPVACHKGTCVGDYVPFYFCPRSVMLFMIHRRNQDLAYQGGQEPIVHLEADLTATVQHANLQPQRWAFTFSNAGSSYFDVSADLSRLSEINWPAVRHEQWGYRGVDPSIKEGKQAEFLLHGSFPWGLVSRIGVRSTAIKAKVDALLRSNTHRPGVFVLPAWYY